jgi:hypothetical protein
MAIKLNPLETTPRQTKFLEIYKQTKDKEFAAQEAWPELPPRRRRTAASHVLTEPRVAQHLKDCGLGVTKLMKTHAKALTAKKTICSNGIFEEVDDIDAQLKAVEMGYKLHRILTPKNEGETATVNVTIDPGRLAEVAARLEAINKKMLPSRQPSTEAEIV